jgi:hypothetical protein
MRSILGYSVFVVGLIFLINAFFPGSLPHIYGERTPYASLKLDPVRTTTIAKNVHVSRVAKFSPGDKLSLKSKSSLDFASFFSTQFAGLKPTPAIADASAHGIAARDDVALGPWRSAVVIEASDASPVTPKASAPLDSRQRYALAREIQAELKRVGCYGGAIDGSWGSASKRAMVAFIERVNASLPLNAPDPILLMLIKSHPIGTCGAGCPAGQALSQNGRCVPDAIIARAGKPAETTLIASASPSTTANATTYSPLPVTANRSGSERWPLEGRMGIGGPPVLGNLADAAGVTTPAPSQSRLTYTESRLTSTAATSFDEPGSYQTVEITQEPQITQAPAPEVAVKRKSASSARRASNSARKNRYASESGYRSVKQLFEHPLGRL